MEEVAFTTVAMTCRAKADVENIECVGFIYWLSLGGLHGRQAEQYALANCHSVGRVSIDAAKTFHTTYLTLEGPHARLVNWCL